GWEGAERVSDPYRAIGDAVGGEDTAHVDAGTAAPHAGLNNVARDGISDHPIEKVAQVAHAHRTDHGERGSRPVAADGADLGIKLAGRPGARRRVVGKDSDERLLEQVE